MSLMRPPEGSVIFSSTPSAPVKKKLFLTNYEDDLITAVVGFLLAGMFLAYLCLCCHVWGLHVRLFQLIKSLRSSDDTNQRNSERRQEERPSISAPMAGTSLEDYTTPPPRYSLVADSLPTYSCAIIRMLGHLRGPVGLRILVYVDPDIRNTSTFSNATPGSNRVNPDLRHSASTSISHERDESPVVSNEVFSVAPGCSSRYNATSATKDAAALENNTYLSDTSGSLYSFQSETCSIEVVSDHSSNCELSALSTTSHSSTENRMKLSGLASLNDSSDIPLPVIASSAISPIESNADISVNTVGAAYADENNNGRCRANWSHDISSAYSANSAPSLPSSRTPLDSFSNTHDIIKNLACPQNKHNNSINNEVINDTSVLSTETREHLVAYDSSDYATLSENRSPSNSIRLLMKGDGGMERVVYALKSTQNCYVANWPIPSEDLLDSEYLEVVVHGQPVEDIFMEFLNEDGELLGMTQLHPSPGSSMLPSRYASTADVPLFATSSPPPLSPTMPPPYHP